MKRLLRFTLGLFVISAIPGLIRRRTYTFRDKVVLITGGSRGLGLVMARRLARQGAKLVLLARDPAELDEAARELRESGADVNTIPADLRDESTPSETIRKTIQLHGRLDVLINNAGIILVGPIDVMRPEDYKEAMDLHFWAPLRFMTAALPFLKESRGRIVNISSFGGKVPVPHLSPYCASKFALAGLSGVFQAELARHGVKITTVFPGLLRTGSHLNALFKGQPAAEFAWFALGSATPVTSARAERAADQILAACSAGTPELIISIQARAAVLAFHIFPVLTLNLLALINRFLPSPGPVQTPTPGFEARGPFPPKVLTTLPDTATRLNNE